MHYFKGMRIGLYFGLVALLGIGSSALSAQTHSTGNRELSSYFRFINDGQGGVTLYQEVPASRLEGQVQVQEFRYRSGERLRHQKHTISTSRWDDSKIFFSATVRFHQNQVQFERRAGQWQNVDSISLVQDPLYCPPEEDGAGDVRQIFNASVDEPQEYVFADASGTLTKPQLIAQMNDDLVWLRDLNLNQKYQLSDLYRKVLLVDIERSNAKKKYGVDSEAYRAANAAFARVFRPYRDAQQEAKEKLFAEVLRARQFQGAAGKERASRLITALTIYGEFRGQTTRRPAYYFWSRSILKNRLRSNYRVRPIAQDTGNQRALMNHMQGLSGAPAISYKQFSTWNPTEMNNLRDILTQPQTDADNEARKEIIQFVAEYELGQWRAPRGVHPRLLQYYSPRSMLPRGSIPDWYVEIRGANPGLGVINSVTKERDKAVDPNWLTVGDFK